LGARGVPGPMGDQTGRDPRHPLRRPSMTGISSSFRQRIDEARSGPHSPSTTASALSAPLARHRANASSRWLGPSTSPGHRSVDSRHAATGVSNPSAPPRRAPLWGDGARPAMVMTTKRCATKHAVCSAAFGHPHDRTGGDPRGPRRPPVSPKAGDDEGVGVGLVRTKPARWTPTAAMGLLGVAFHARHAGGGVHADDIDVLARRPPAARRGDGGPSNVAEVFGLITVMRVSHGATPRHDRGPAVR